MVPKASRKWGGSFHNDAEHRDFTAIGTAAGQPATALLTCASHVVKALERRANDTMLKNVQTVCSTHVHHTCLTSTC